MNADTYPVKLGYTIDNLAEVTQAIVSFNTDVWKSKKMLNLSLKSEISDVEIPLVLAEYEDGLTAMHNLL